MSFLQTILGSVGQVLRQNNLEFSVEGISKALAQVDMQQAQNFVMQALNNLGGGSGVSNIEQAKDKIIQALFDAAADGDISLTEMAEVKGMQKILGISDAQLAEMKLKVLNQLAQKVISDNQVSDNEMQIILEIEKDLQFSSSEQDSVRQVLEKVKSLYKKA
ncbi:MAG: hypothetical protein RML72_01585 [Bacteroidia bacterium]|nr:hypothetical protein [Bacteroidia bacterium]MDW8157551.1 hypothetical protein [Bacteroidia bacterium]